MVDEADLAPELDLRDYLRVLWRRRALIGLTILVAVVGALVASFLQPTTYTASAELTLTSFNTDPFSSTTTAVVVNPDRNVQNEITIIESKTVKNEVRRLIGAAPSATAVAEGQTNTIVITASAPEAQQAADIANAYATAYINVKRAQAVSGLLATVSQVQAKIDDFGKQISNIDQQVAATSPDRREQVAAGLANQRQNLVNQQNTYQQRIDQLQVGASLQNGGAEITSPATAPSSPSSPKPARSAILAFAVGLILGVGAALLFEYLDDSIRSKEDFERAMGGLPTIGLIPQVPGWKSADQPYLATLEDPTSPASEAYRSLRTSVRFLSVSNPTAVIQVTSANPGEGKTTTVANLAVSMAQAGQTVCVVCCDLRRPRAHQFFGLKSETGITSILAGDSTLAAALQPVAEVDGLQVLAAGPIPPNPAELLASERAGQVFQLLRTQFDVILVDSPPVLAVTDAAVLSPLVDATLLVAQAGATRRRALARSCELLEQIGAPLAGGVLNGATADTGGYDYVKGYGSYRSAPV